MQLTKKHGRQAPTGPGGRHRDEIRSGAAAWRAPAPKDYYGRATGSRSRMRRMLSMLGGCDDSAKAEVQYSVPKGH